MIFIMKNFGNDIILTLSESSSLSNPYFLFEFTNQFDIQAEPIYFMTDDISTSTIRYNHFILTESTGGTKTGGYNVSLNLISGQYKYRVYESTGITTSLSATTGRIIEEGRMVVDSNTNNNTIYSIYD